MENLTLIGSILAVQILAWLTPGPNIVLIVRNSLIYSRKSGIWTAVGIAVGNCVHITYTVTGLALIISTTPFAFNAIKFLGIGYLIYLGIKTIFIRVETKEEDTVAQRHYDLTPFQAAKTGFITNILSPKAPLFFASIFAMVVESGAPLWVVMVLWIAMPLNSFMMATLHSLLFSLKRVRHAVAKYQRIVNALLGMALILLASILASANNNRAVFNLQVQPCG